LRAEPWVLKLPRQAGQKEVRYRHLFSGAPAPGSTSAPAPSAAAPVAAPAVPAVDRVSLLEKRVEALEALVKNLAPAAPKDESAG
jgi:uncharacterized protein YceH (UPF0502 family)